MADALTYRCDIKQTHRGAAECRDRWHCGQRAEFIVHPATGKATAQNSKLTCAQHMSKAVRTVLATTEVRQVKVTILGADDTEGVTP